MWKVVVGSTVLCRNVHMDCDWKSLCENLRAGKLCDISEVWGALHTAPKQ